MHTALWTLAAVSVVGAFVAAARPRTHGGEADQDDVGLSEPTVPEADVQEAAAS
jgi:hypothetical protein